MLSCKPIKLKPSVKKSETWGIFKILAYTGQKLIETRHPHYEHTFLTKCKVCGKVKWMRQTQIKRSKHLKQKWCRSCPPEARKRGGNSAVAAEAKQQRAKRTPADRRSVNTLAESTKWR